MAASWYRAFAGVLAAIALGCGGGCQALYELQPHRLQRLNRGQEAMQSGADAYYSVQDPLPPSEVEEDAATANH